MVDATTGRSKGFGFVRFQDGATRDLAVVETDGLVIGSRPIRSRVAMSRRGRGAGADAGMLWVLGGAGAGGPGGLGVGGAYGQASPSSLLRAAQLAGMAQYLLPGDGAGGMGGAAMNMVPPGALGPMPASLAGMQAVQAAQLSGMGQYFQAPDAAGMRGGLSPAELAGPAGPSGVPGVADRGALASAPPPAGPSTIGWSAANVPAFWQHGGGAPRMMTNQRLLLSPHGQPHWGTASQASALMQQAMYASPGEAAPSTSAALGDAGGASFARPSSHLSLPSGHSGRNGNDGDSSFDRPSSSLYGELPSGRSQPDTWQG